MKHLAIILDGNRRWAHEQGLATFEGHYRGYENVKTIGLAALERGIEYLSVFGFSTENWKRSQEEVGYLMGLLHLALTREVDFFLEHGVRLRLVGDMSGLSESLQKAALSAQEKTSQGSRGQINLCINYGGRAEILAGVKKLMQSGTDPQSIDERAFSDTLWTAGIPDPDLIIRTSGEQRLSGFLTWSGVYSELKFVDTYWPDFSVDLLDECLGEYEERQRRFGL